MPRIRLAAWYGGAAPGTELDVDDVQLKEMTRDGLVAALVEAPAPAVGPTADQAVDEPAAETPADEAPAGRKRR